MLFENFLRAVMGMNPDRMSDAKYEKMFGDFKANVLGHERPERQADLVPPKPLQSRIKELYRQLVRRLHPDTRAESDAEVSAVWHEVQEAYSDGNVERLEMLLAMTDLQENATGEHTSLSQMRSVLSELRRSYMPFSGICGRRKAIPRGISGGCRIARLWRSASNATSS